MSTATQYQSGPAVLLATGPADNGHGPLLDQVLQATSDHRYTIAELEKISQKAASSGMFNSGGEGGTRPLTPDQAFMFGLIAEALKMPYALVLMRFEIVMGKPSMKSAYVQAKFQEQGGSVEWVETTGERVKAIFACKRHPKPFTLELTLQELMDRNIAKSYNKDRKQWETKYQYQNNPRAMLRYRCVTEAVRAIDPGILMGFYTEIEAEDFEQPESVKAEAETAVRTALVTHLAGRRENPKDLHPPVAETAAALKEAAKTEEATKEPETAWGKVIAEATLQTNQALAELAEANPDRVGLRTAIKPQQVVQAVLSHFIEAGTIDQAAIQNEKGKRGSRQCSEMMGHLWADCPGDLEAAVAKYLGAKLTELMGPAVAPAQAELAMA